MKQIPKRPKTMHVKTNLLMVGDWVVHYGNLWKIKDIKISGYAKVVLTNDERDIEIHDRRCSALGSQDLDKSSQCMWWRVVCDD